MLIPAKPTLSELSIPTTVHEAIGRAPLAVGVAIAQSSWNEPSVAVTAICASVEPSTNVTGQ